jgi:hypothetical protein
VTVRVTIVAVQHIGFSVADVPATIALLRAKGGKQTQAYLADHDLSLLQVRC